MAGVLWPCSCFCFLFLTVPFVKCQFARLFSASPLPATQLGVSPVREPRGPALLLLLVLCLSLFFQHGKHFTRCEAFCTAPIFPTSKVSKSIYSCYRWKWSTALLRRCGDNKAVRALDVTFESVRYVRIFWLFGDLMALPLRRKLLLGHWKCSPRSSDHDAAERKCGFSLAIDAVFPNWVVGWHELFSPVVGGSLLHFNTSRCMLLLVLRGLETMRRIRYLRSFAIFFGFMRFVAIV
jgi:hypothetical protein